ncbi:MAG: hypothetical protein C0593_03055 [Marinilabiliales bacterium]|nr:MAG: hypothetical protein C0593_03055 [Marinilabiliales bacterium]
MKNRNSNPENAARLRQKAEEKLKAIKSQIDKYVSEADKLKLIHELEVHQIELELQNEELVTAKEKAEQAEGKYTDLYDFAPSGYLSLTKEGKIFNLNFAAARMLGKERSKLINSRFPFFLSESTRPVFNQFLEKTISGSKKQTCEVRIETQDKSEPESHSLPIYVTIDGIVNQNGDLCHLTVVDISKRKHLEIAIKESEKLLSAIAENFPNSYLSVINSDFTIGLTSGQQLRKQNLDPKQFEGLKLNQVFGDKTGFILEKYKRTFQGKEQTFEMFFNNQYQLYKTAPLYAEDGSIPRILSVVENITRRKQAEEELIAAKEKAEKSEERFNLAMQAANDGIFDWNLETNEIYYSPAWKKMLGYEEHELPNDFSVWETTTEPEDVKKSWELQQKLITKQIDRFVIEFKMKHKNGHWIDVLSRAEAVFDDNGKAVRMVGTHTDITERKQAELELIDSEQRFRSLVNTINSGVVFYKVINEGESGNDYIIQNFNDFALKHENINEEDVFGKSLKDIRPNIDDYGLINTFREVWETGKPAFFPAKLYIDEKYCNYYENRVFKISTGEIVAVYDDVTTREIAHVALKEALEKAEESDRLKSAFLANMSHEIRTPMNGILGFADLLKEPGLAGDKQQKYIGIIEKSGERMLNIINDIIDISKIEARLMELNLKTTNVNEQIEYTYTFFKPEAERKGIKLSFNNTLPSKEATTKTDSEKLYAILINLVKNALKYTEKGSIELGYNLKSGNGPNELEFYFKDTGVGIPKDRQEAIFERFIQADIADIKARQGAGLGLAITKAYVEMLGGKIWVESEEGIGSTFYFTLPYNTEQDAEIKRQIELSEKNKTIRKLKMLIAEDDEVSEILIDSYIKTFSKEIIKTRTGTEAIVSCRQNTDIDLILMDIRMPEMGGYEATRLIREFNKEVVIIAQTAYGLTGDREKAIEAGCNDYIAKPIKKEELQAIILRYFGN